MKKIILLISLVLASGVLMTNIYNSFIDAKSWGSDMPNSIEAARQYFKTVNPGNFYRAISPVVQLAALLCVILFWKAGKKIRLALIGALIVFVGVDVLTFAYFYPRNDIMFFDAIDMGKIRVAWQEWTSMNWVRTSVFAIGVFCTGYSVHAVYSTKAVRRVSISKLAA